MDKESSPPDMTDMFLAGLELREAVAIHRAIKNQPDVPADQWWRLITSSLPSGNC
jgi:hypothetical protein